MRWFTAKVRYVLERATRISPTRILGFARQAQRITPRTPLPFIIVDMFFCVVRYQTTFEHYAQWDYRILKGRERRTFMTEPISAMLSRRLNSQAKRAIFDDKIRFAQHFPDDIGRDWLDARSANADQVSAFLARHGRVLAKDPGGVGGDGISVYDAETCADPKALRAEVIADGKPLLEEFLQQHEEMSRLYPGSVNTLRIVTYRDPSDEVHVLARVLKIGNGGFIDNYSGGGMYTMVDESGRALHAAYDGAGTVFDRHPSSGVHIEGFQVPLFDDVIAFAKDLATRVPEMPYIGWDIAITPTRPVVIEGNHNTGVFQSRPAVTGTREGLLPVYRAAMDF
ncbi:sugar-transfer associated ATP-grasp domain-containing protein [Microbacterium sp. No. 7]|uniref:sugar-transfer associated ATP-grasp domain-containing protein n=1 Tax=Microbacterium sp. No. 7 TaxID=1714373 RepID=UPI0006D1987E|nr:sugar-transfer associated ATP-grasp domain-containing protein [Microbacterium sp. No. 7]ALJ20445.1 hypothetical protein AOA12_11220 [Microbacterium sp. No. 7]